MRNKKGPARRKARVRAKVSGVSARPRLSVFRSNRNIYAQIIDDTTGKTLASASGASKIEAAFSVGEVLAKKALKAKIKTVVFDKGEYKYHGRIKALAEGARKGGLNF